MFEVADEVLSPLFECSDWEPDCTVPGLSGSPADSTLDAVMVDCGSFAVMPGDGCCPCATIAAAKLKASKPHVRANADLDNRICLPAFPGTAD
jgi:hypothetical protein